MNDTSTLDQWLRIQELRLASLACVTSRPGTGTLVKLDIPISQTACEESVRA
jgi:hypothetical protein